MIRIARHTDYGVRLVLHLACLPPDAQVSIGEVAEQRLLPIPFVRRMVGRLVKAGILSTSRGSGGGIKLARPASQISMGDVVRAMEGKLALNHCVSHPRTCPFSDGCPVQVAWTRISQALEQELDATRFDALARGTKGHASAHVQLTKAKPSRPASRKPPR